MTILGDVNLSDTLGDVGRFAPTTGSQKPCGGMKGLGILVPTLASGAPASDMNEIIGGASSCETPKPPGDACTLRVGRVSEALGEQLGLRDGWVSEALGEQLRVTRLIAAEAILEIPTPSGLALIVRGDGRGVTSGLDLIVHDDRGVKALGEQDGVALLIAAAFSVHSEYACSNAARASSSGPGDLLWRGVVLP